MVLGNTVTALGTLRALRPLRKEKVRIYLGSTSRADNIAWHSNIPDRKILFGEGLIEGLLRLGKSLSEPAPLLLTRDDEVVEVSRHREALAPYFRFLLPPDEIVTMLMAKGDFTRFALEKGLSIPATEFVANPDELSRIPGKLGFPFILKPYLQHAIRIDDAGALREAINELEPRHYESMIAQEYIDGGDDQLYFAFLLFDRSGRLVHRMMGRKLRQWPVSYGTTSLAVTVSDDRLLQEMDTFSALCPVAGYLSLEYKYDSARDRFVIMEPTIGRFNQQIALSAASGVNFPMALVSLLNGEEVRLLPQQDKVHWIYESNDLLSYWKNGTPYGYLENFLKSGTSVLASLSDPGPVFYECWDLGRKRLRKILKHD